MTETDDSKQVTTPVNKSVKLEENFKKLLKDYISEGGLEESIAQALYAKFKNYKTDDEKQSFYNKAYQSFEAATENYEFINTYNKRERFFNDTMELNGAMESYLNKYIAEQESLLSKDEVNLNQEALLNEQMYNKNSNNKVYKTLDDLIKSAPSNSNQNIPTTFEHSSNIRDLGQAPVSNLPDLETLNQNFQNTIDQEAQQESQFQSFQDVQSSNNINSKPSPSNNMSRNINSLNSSYFKTPSNANQAFKPLNNPNPVTNNTQAPILQQNPNTQNPKVEYPNFYQG